MATTTVFLIRFYFFLQKKNVGKQWRWSINQFDLFSHFFFLCFILEKKETPEFVVIQSHTRPG